MSRRPRVLLVLPCNKGAKIGNYFVGHAWRVALKALRECGIRRYVMLAAVDCIPFKMSLGDCVVLETEMDRVKGYDVYPSYDERVVDGLTDCIERGLRRVLPLFDIIYVVLNVPLYQVCVKKALSRIKSDKIVYVEPGDNRPGKFAQFVKRVVRRIARELLMPVTAYF